MRRFRIRRRRALAIALLPVAAITTTTSFGLAADHQAAIKPSKSTVTIGNRVMLRGEFPNAPNAEVEIRFRAAGHKRFERVAHTRTGPGSHYGVGVKPHGSGLWRADLVRQPRPAAAASTAAQPAGVDGRSDSKRIRVRSKVNAGVSKHDTLAGRFVGIRGRVSPRTAGRKVVIHAGHQAISTRTNRNGRYKASWRPPSPGSYKVTVDARGDRSATGSSDGAGKVVAYRRATASWYGPGLYGGRTACGQTLSSGTLGVANKSLPCGTKVHLKYGSHEITVPVIDRGPYVAGREYDLTYATKKRLGFPDVATVLSSR